MTTASRKSMFVEGSGVVIRTMPLEDIKERPLEEVLQEVLENETYLVVRMPDGEEVVIEPKSRLKPLPELEGRVPAGWKDAVYARG